MCGGRRATGARSDGAPHVMVGKAVVGGSRVK